MTGTRKTFAALATLAVAASFLPQAATAAPPALTAAVRTVHGSGASAATSLNVLTLNDQRRIDNRISAWVGPTGRLVLSAPEGLGDPDGTGSNCGLDNAKPAESSAQEVSCAPGYIGVIAGDLNRGSDTFDADPG